MSTCVGLQRFAPMIALISAILSLAVPAPAAQDSPLTVAESSAYTATTRHADMMGFIAELQRRSSRIRVETLAVSTEGRAVPMLVIGDPPPATPAEARRDGRSVVYLQANIHAGEVEGKEAALMLARDIVLPEQAPAFLDGLVVLIVPMFNADGNERISANNRRNQQGPEQGVGERHNGQNLDLNREGIKLETPEARGLVTNALNRWDPLFFLDAHTHNGSYHEEPVTWVWGVSHNADRGIVDYQAQTMMPAIDRALREEHDVLSVPHGDFVDVDDPEKGWIPLGPQARYLSNYVGLRNRFSLLNENYPYADFRTRVEGCYALMLELLEYIGTHRDEMAGIVADADRRTVRMGVSPGPDDGFGVEYDVRQLGDPYTVRGYAMKAVPRESGWPRVEVDFEDKRTYQVPFLADYYATRSVPWPHGYLLPVSAPDIEDKLLQHGLLVEKLIEPASAEVLAFTPAEITTEERLFQGHQMRRAEGTYEMVEMEFPVGTLFVSAAQPLGRVAATMLEPESDDGLLAWNFIDRYLSRGFGAPPTFPIFKLAAPAHLVTVTLLPR